MKSTATVERVTFLCHVSFQFHIYTSSLVGEGGERVRRVETAVPFLPVYVCVLTAPRSVESLNARTACDSPTCSGKTHTLRGGSEDSVSSD